MRKRRQKEEKKKTKRREKEDKKKAKRRQKEDKKKAKKGEGCQGLTPYLTC